MSPALAQSPPTEAQQQAPAIPQFSGAIFCAHDCAFAGSKFVFFVGATFGASDCASLK